MTLAIRSTVAPATAHRHLASTQRDLDRSLERLSSGLRVNRAADDAAGLAISEGLRSRVGGLTVGLRNARDAISLIGTGEAALASSHAILHRMRDLTVRAGSGALDDDARAALATEMRSLRDGLERIAASTAVNGRALLDGTFHGRFQIGAGVGDTLDVAVPGAGTRALGVTAFSLGDGLADVVLTPGRADFGGHPATPAEHHLEIADDAAVADLVAGLADPSTDVAVDGVTVDLTAVTTIDGLVAAFDGTEGVVATRTGTGITLAAEHAGPDPFVVTGLDAVPSTSVPGTDAVPDAGGNPAALAARVDLADVGGTIRLGSGRTFDLASVSRSVAALPPADRAAALRSSLEEAFAGTVVTVTDDGALTVTAGESSDASFTVVGSATDVVLRALDRAIGTVSTTRAGLGAAQNRLEHVLAAQEVALENLAAARSRIRDADMAAEAAGMTRASILRDAGTALAGQASSAPRQLLRLLAP